MSDESKCTELGCMTPAHVVQCAEDSNTYCWIAATMIAKDGSEVSYECCGGAGKKAEFRLQQRGGAARSISAAEVPSSLTWVRRSVV